MAQGYKGPGSAPPPKKGEPGAAPAVVGMGLQQDAAAAARLNRFRKMVRELNPPILKHRRRPSGLDRLPRE